MDPPDSREADSALEAERQFVLTLGGFTLEIAGANLVTHERLPVPRFNFVEELGVGPERQSPFFERALDHYFQRALRPTFRVPNPVAPHLDAGLRRFGFLPREAPLVLLTETPGHRDVDSPAGVRPARPSELDLVAAFWTNERERPEFRAALDVAWSHPNPPEQLVPLLAFRDDEPVAVALVYRYRDSAGIHGVATRPTARGRGAATDLVRFALAANVAGRGARYSIFADSARIQQRLERLGFRAARTFRVYELPAGAELAVPFPGPPAPPRWRPPRN
jgi:RimJ/RimL family protein N-acetyltransferase